MKILVCICIGIMLMPAFARQLSLSKQEALKVARMTAHDQGYTLEGSDVSMEAGGLVYVGHPIPKYMQISMDLGAHPVQHYAIREDTGDVVDWVSCQLFRYPDLMEFQKARIKITGARLPSDDQLAQEVGCDFTVLSQPKALGKPMILKPCDAY